MKIRDTHEPTILNIIEHQKLSKALDVNMVILSFCIFFRYMREDSIKRKTTYVYWTVHHLLCILLNIFRMLVHSSSGACDCVWVYCCGSTCTGVTVWFGWGDVTEALVPQPA